MRVYFVRHGETPSNIEGVLHQDPDEPLTQRGEQQAAFLAGRFARIPIDAIFSSTMRRARDTAYVLGKGTGHSVLFSDLFVEIRRPSELKGIRASDPNASFMMNESYRAGKDPSWKYSDEESFAELRDRAQKALAFVTASGFQSVAVVTHGAFLRLLIALMSEGDDLTHASYAHFLHFLKTRNTGITMADYDPEHVHWHLLAWNDHAHLGEVTK